MLVLPIANNQSAQNCVQYQFIFCKELKAAYEHIKGYQTDKLIKGNVTNEINCEILFQNIKKCLLFNFKSHFKDYFQLEDNQIEQLRIVNKNSQNFVYQIISSFIFQTTIYSLHKIETAEDFLSHKRNTIETLLEIDFQNNKIVSGKEGSNKYFWKKTRTIEKDGLIFELQTHKYQKNTFMNGVSSIIRTINPMSPHNKDFRIIVYSPESQEIHVEIFQSNDIQELQIKMDNIEKDPQQRFQYNSLYKTHKQQANFPTRSPREDSKNPNQVKFSSESNKFHSDFFAKEEN